jgi:hypothetical protein
MQLQPFSETSGEQNRSQAVRGPLLLIRATKHKLTRKHGFFY